MDSPAFNTMDDPLEHIGHLALIDVTDALPAKVEHPTTPELLVTFCCLFLLILSDSLFSSVLTETR